MRTIVLRNSQRATRVNTRSLRRIIGCLLEEHLSCDRVALGIHLVDIQTITHLNETYLKHRGPTDVIAFDYSNSARRRSGGRKPDLLAGDVFVCVPEAIKQAPRYRSAWQTELVRYVVHGILHLCGYDDKTPAGRRKMKREEARLLKRLTSEFRLA